jgi:transposase-like protein
MKKGQRKKYSADLKGKIALEAVKGQLTFQEIASHYGVHPNMLTNWKRQLLNGVSELIPNPKVQSGEADDQVWVELYKQLESYKSNWIDSRTVRTFMLEQRRPWIEPGHKQLSIVEPVPIGPFIAMS